jgi:hypothetical protein
MSTADQPSAFPPPPVRPRREDFTDGDDALAEANYQSALHNWSDMLMPAWIESTRAVLERDGMEAIDLLDGHGLPADPSRASFPGRMNLQTTSRSTPRLGRRRVGEGPRRRCRVNTR